MIDLDASAARIYRETLSELRSVEPRLPDSFGDLAERDRDLVRGFVCSALRAGGFELTARGVELADRAKAWARGNLESAGPSHDAPR